MSRQRKLKKQRKRRKEWVENLEDLYLRQADVAFLEAARPHFRELDAGSVAGLYDEVVDRALAGALTGGDPAKVGELLARIRRDAEPRPLVLLAEAVDLLAKGRRDPAAARLAALGEAGEAELGIARHLPEMLRALAQPAMEPDADAARPPGPWREIEEMARLSRTLEAHAVAGKGLLRSLELESPPVRAGWNFYRALAAVGARSFRPGAKTLATLTRAVEALRSEAPVDGALERLLRKTQKYLRALAALHKLEQSVRRSRRGAKLEELLLEKLSTAGGLSAKLLLDDPPPLLRPLRHALRTRWRSLLELVSDHRGAAGLAALFAARPELFVADLDPASGVEEARRWAEARALLESESFAKLGAFLSTASARAETAERLAALWSLELWARREAPWGAAGRGSFHRSLLRLLEMAAAISGRFAAVERSQVARFLRDELFELCGELFFCEHSQATAEALLEHLDDDPGLLIVALAGAVCSRDQRARPRIAERIVARGTAHANRESLLLLVESVSAERPEDAAPVLTALRPLFADTDWSEVLDRFEAEAVEGIREGLVAAFEDPIEDPEHVAWILKRVRRDVDLLRPLLGERPELAALDVAVLGWDAEPSSAKLQVSQFLCRFKELEPALVLYRQALELSQTADPQDIDPAIVGAVVDRLDVRWRLWASLLGHLAADATPAQLRRLRKKVRGFSKDKALSESVRESFRLFWKAIGKIGRLKARAGKASLSSTDFTLPELEPPEPEPRPAKRRARRHRPVDDRQLELFATE